MPLNPGEILDNRYRVVQSIGEGGFGAVYRAWDLRLNSSCVLKESLDTTPEAMAQFEREAQILHRMRHAGLPVVHNFFNIPGQGLYVVMDYVEGDNLMQILEKRNAPVSESEALDWVLQVLDALAYLHSQTPPIIHRDIKPQNIIITPQGKAMLVDFGVAKVYDPRHRTTLGARAVTPGYSPPEQYLQTGTDARSDLYALGALLYHLLTNQVPPESISLSMGMVLPDVRVYNPKISPAVAAAVQKAMNYQASARFQNAQEFKAALSGQALPSSVRFQPANAPALATPAMVPPEPAWTIAAGSPAAPRAASGKKSAWLWAGLGALGVTICVIAALVGGLPAAKNLLATDTPTVRPTKTKTPTPRYTPTPKMGDTRVSPVDGMVQVYVPAGEFLMGADTGYDYDKPSHTVFLDAFWIDRTEVTNAMYALCVEAGGCTPLQTTSSNTRTGYYGASDYANYPVVNMDWNQADAYCRWAGRSLPSEAQWEKAARGTDGRDYPWGSGVDCSLANYSGCGIDDTAAVGSYLSGASPYGALDMSGNVWEWVADYFNETYYTLYDYNNPTGPVSGDRHSVRGGSFSVGTDDLFTYRRWGDTPEGYHGMKGFRCGQAEVK